MGVSLVGHLRIIYLSLNKGMPACALSLELVFNLI